ncbi:MAG: hypothetical protein HC824_06590 [Synechococcales cyanobacterium RM1_1_8]|nr:hypothetical protein [Synechococcales cyanobacterium RM1_1_8]
MQAGQNGDRAARIDSSASTTQISGDRDMAALLCITVTLAGIECVLLMGQSKRLYTPLSLGAVVATALLLSSIAVNSGLIAATGFTLTYLALALGLLLFNASLYSLETLFIPIVSSVVLVVELMLFIAPIQLMFSSWMPVLGLGFTA